MRQVFSFLCLYLATMKILQLVMIERFCMKLFTSGLTENDNFQIKQPKKSYPYVEPWCFFVFACMPTIRFILCFCCCLRCEDEMETCMIERENLPRKLKIEITIFHQFQQKCKTICIKFSFFNVPEYWIWCRRLLYQNFHHSWTSAYKKAFVIMEIA